MSGSLKAQTREPDCLSSNPSSVTSCQCDLESGQVLNPLSLSFLSWDMRMITVPASQRTERINIYKAFGEVQSVVSTIYRFVTTILLSPQNDDEETCFPHCLLPQLSMGINGGKITKGTREDTGPPGKCSLPQSQEMGSKGPGCLDPALGLNEKLPVRIHSSDTEALTVPGPLLGTPRAASWDSLAGGTYSVSPPHNPV